MRALIFLLYLFPLTCAAAPTPPDIDAYISSETKVEVYAGRYIDQGDYNNANALLARAVTRYPNNDLILSLYGKSLFESGSQKKSEIYFMQALKHNNRNEVAQSYINKIRQIRVSTHSESSQEWALIFKDKIGDMIVFIISIWVGTSLSSIWKKISNEYRWRQAQDRFKRRKYRDVVRILESHVHKMDQDEIDRCLAFILQSEHSMEELLAIIKKYIIRNEDYAVIERSLILLNNAETTR